MASIASLLRGGSMVPDGAGGFTFKLGSKFQWDTKKLKRKISDANAKALRRAGRIVMENSRSSIASRKPLGSKAETPQQWVQRSKKWTVATRGGMKLVAVVDKVPLQDKLTSWKTARFPKGFLRSSIEYDYDYQRESVAIGPTKSPRVNKLHEFGGTNTYYFMPIRVRTAQWRNTVYGRIQTRRPMVKGTRIAQSGVFSFTRTIKARPYMARGLAKAKPDIPDCYRNTVIGP